MNEKLSYLIDTKITLHPTKNMHRDVKILFLYKHFENISKDLGPHLWNVVQKPS